MISGAEVQSGMCLCVWRSLQETIREYILYLTVKTGSSNTIPSSQQLDGVERHPSILITGLLKLNLQFRYAWWD